ncbi:cytidine deaminase-like protein [Agrocybe pediades]|nr:cytidine deaminase-like protein [Agrocybe pediades]
MSKSSWDQADERGMQLALQEARTSFEQGGIPIGACLIVLNDSEPSGYKVLGSGHNQRIQRSSATLHGEISALENVGRLKAEVYRRATMYTTLSPCHMCTGAILLYNIQRVVIGENTTFMGGEDLLRQRGVELVVLDNQECKDLMASFISAHPEEWNEDIGQET